MFVWYPTWTGTVKQMANPQGGRPARLQVGLIGAGRAGSVVAAALERAGHRVVAASAVSQHSRDRAERLLPNAAIVDPLKVAESCDLLVLAVPDDQLAALIGGLASAAVVRDRQIAVHLSGRFGVDVLRPLSALGCVTAAIHPAMTLTGQLHEVQRLDSCPFAVSADPADLPVALALVVEMGGDPQVVDDEHRSLYHAALSHAANHVVTMTAQAQELLVTAGIDAPGRFLAPLMSAALDNALRAGDTALTGPVARGDAGTLTDHVQAIEQFGAQGPVEQSTARSYSALARATIVRAHAQHRLNAEQTDSLLAALQDLA
jgi:predicted short-subunit dehydrogenase-like oxidoreductase (DUF2520 family)